METENKAVLISVKPKWCELILRGKKTIEVRKQETTSKEISLRQMRRKEIFGGQPLLYFFQMRRVCKKL